MRRKSGIPPSSFAVAMLLLRAIVSADRRYRLSSLNLRFIRPRTGWARSGAKSGLPLDIIDFLTLGFTAVPTRRCSSSAEKVLCPLLIVVRAGDPPHQLGWGNVLELARRHTVAQRLQRVVNRLHRGREWGMSP